MKNLDGTKTQANLLAAFAGECMARTRYNFYADKAKKEGYELIAEIFNLTADNERAHAKVWFNTLHGKVGATLDNLLDGAKGEHAEWSDMYKRFAAEAKEEGFDDIADLFKMVGDIEYRHEQRYRDFYDNLKNGKVFSSDVEKEWVCKNCGHVHFGVSAPQTCPVCSHPMGYFY